MIEEIGTNGSKGNHSNLLQWGTGPISTGNVIVAYNTAVQTQATAGAGEGYQFDPNVGDVVSNVVFENNVIVAHSAGGKAMSYAVHGDNVKGGVYSTNSKIAENYFDVTGAYGAFYPGSFGPGWQIYDNWDMVSGLKLVPAP